MAAPWLTITRQDTGSYHKLILAENLDVYDQMEATRMVLKFGQPPANVAFHESAVALVSRHTVWAWNLDESTMIADCDPHRGIADRPSEEPRRTPILHQLPDTSVSLERTFMTLCAQVLMPTSSVIIVFADTSGGVGAAAKFLASLLSSLPLTDVQLRPRLMIITDNPSYTENVCRHDITSEMLQQLRVLHPDTPRAFHEVREMWTSRLHGMQLVRSERFLDCFTEALDEISASRKESGFEYTPKHFDRLLRETIKCFPGKSPLSIMRCLGIQNQFSTQAQRHLERLLTDATYSTINRFAIASSCLAFKLFPVGCHVFPPSNIFGSLAASLLSERVRQLPGAIQTLFQSFSEIVLRLQQSNTITEDHMRLIKSSKTVLPGCNMCLFEKPLHQLSCGHAFCYVCVTRISPLRGGDFTFHNCLLCGMASSNIIQVIPPGAGIRSLVLSSSARSTIKSLYSIRQLLFGPLEDYFDIAVGSEKASYVMVGCIRNGSSPQKCARDLKKDMGRRWLYRTRNALTDHGGQMGVVVLDGPKGEQNYDDRYPQGGRCRFSLARHENRRRQDSLSPSEQADVECEANWSSKPWIKIEFDGEQMGSYRPVANRLFAALFYARVVQVPTFTRAPITCQLEVRCRLLPGRHLNAVMHQAKHQKLHIHLRVSGKRQRVDLCGDYWERVQERGFSPFSRVFSVTIASPEDVLDLEIDGPYENREPMGGFPCSFRSLVEAMPDEPCSVDRQAAKACAERCDDSKSQRSMPSETFGTKTMPHEPCSVDRQATKAWAERRDDSKSQRSMPSEIFGTDTTQFAKLLGVWHLD